MRRPWRRLSALILLTLPVVTPPGVSAALLDAREVVDQLQIWLDETRDLQCRFEQTLVSGALGTGIRETGRLYVKRPGKMRWEYTRPDEKLAVVNDDEILLYLPEDEQMIRGEAALGESLLPALLSGGDRLTALFLATLVATPEAGGQGDYQLRLVPRERAEEFEAVTLTLRPPRFSIEAAEVLDPLGNRMRYEFKSLRRNRGLGDELFVFRPPAGTDIVDPS